MTYGAVHCAVSHSTCRHFDYHDKYVGHHCHNNKCKDELDQFLQGFNLDVFHCEDTQCVESKCAKDFHCDECAFVFKFVDKVIAKHLVSACDVGVSQDVLYAILVNVAEYKPKCHNTCCEKCHCKDIIPRFFGDNLKCKPEKYAGADGNHHVDGGTADDFKENSKEIVCKVCSVRKGFVGEDMADFKVGEGCSHQKTCKNHHKKRHRNQSFVFE